MNEMTLTIKGLFGHFDYEIPLYGLDSPDGIPMSDGVTILTGPNGYGKSTILRALEAIGKGDLNLLSNLKFQKLTLSYTNGDKDNVTIQKAGHGLIVNNDTFTLNDIEEYTAIYNPPETNPRGFNLDTLPNVVLNGRIEHSKGVVFNVYNSPREPFSLPVLSIRDVENEGIPEATADMFTRIYSLMTKSISKTFMIREQRLIEATSSGVRDVVKDISPKLQSHFSEMSNRYSEKSTELDSSFPYRLLNQPSEHELTQEDFDRFYQDMNEKLRILNENGLSEAVQQEIPAFQAEKAGILRVFFDDFNEKYKVYAPLVEKLTLFRKILNRRFRTFKRVEISREYGLRVRDIRKDENGAEIAGEVIPPESLSSGEQETLVLYYQLIFETEPGTMLLIDEPEISLHIAWQRHFIDELKEIVRLNSLRAVVATHSASIIGRHRDIQIDLGALYQDELDRQHTKQGRPDQRNSAGSE